MANVLVTHRLPGDGVGRIGEAGHDVAVHEGPPMTRAQLIEAVAGRAGLVTLLSDRIDAEVFDAAGEGLRVVSNYAVGYNNVDLDEATRRGVAVCNTPGVLTEATADLAWALVMAVSRRVVEGDRLVRGGGWTGWKPDELLGVDLVGRTLVIVGAGRIGHAVARRSRGWSMNVVYVSRQRNELFERDFAAPKMDLDEALAMGDIVSLHVPLTESTRHMIDGRRLARMKPTACLVNTSRGPVVDEAALVEALASGTIAGAGLDVYEREPALAEGLAGCGNAVLLPHLGSATSQTRAAMSEVAAENLLAALAGERPRHVVNPAAIRAWPG